MRSSKRTCKKLSFLHFLFSSSGSQSSLPNDVKISGEENNIGVPKVINSQSNVFSGRSLDPTENLNESELNFSVNSSILENMTIFLDITDQSLIKSTLNSSSSINIGDTGTKCITENKIKPIGYDNTENSHTVISFNEAETVSSIPEANNPEVAMKTNMNLGNYICIDGNEIRQTLSEENSNFLVMTNVPIEHGNNCCDENVTKSNTTSCIADICNKTSISNETRNSTDRNISSDFIPSDLDASENNTSGPLNWAKMSSDPVDERQLEITSSKFQNKSSSKKYFCHYCKTLQTKFARHLENKHKNEVDVRNFMCYPVNSVKRKKIIEKIRKYGNFLHNTDASLNTGTLIVARRPQEKYRKSSKNYTCCGYCGGYYAKSNLRSHYKDCNKKHVKGAKGQLLESRQITGYSHPRASEKMRRKIIPGFNDDNISTFIKYDLLLILFGNKLSDLYTLKHEEEKIRNNLRLLARLTATIITYDVGVTDFASIFNPKVYDSVIKGIKYLAKFDEDTEVYRIPYNALTLGILIKKAAHVLSAECVKTGDVKKKKNLDSFLTLFENDYPTINKKVIEDQSENRRLKKVTLPSKSDIKILYNHIKTMCERAITILENGFDIEAWTELSEGTLILLQIFNCRRPGEIERCKIQNYENRETIDSVINSDLFDRVSTNAKDQAKQFVRFIIRGKRHRDVPVLLHNFLTRYIDNIIKYRCRAGINPNNEYLFAIPSSLPGKGYRRACPLMRKFADSCGAENPTTLRGTLLRKHIATYSAMLGITDNQVADLANFMGHDESIHKNVYRVPTGVKDMTEVSKILEAAMGVESDEDDEPLENQDQIVLDQNIEGSIETEHPRPYNNDSMYLCQPSTSQYHKGK